MSSGGFLLVQDGIFYLNVFHTRAKIKHRLRYEALLNVTPFNAYGVIFLILGFPACPTSGRHSLFICFLLLSPNFRGFFSGIIFQEVILQFDIQRKVADK